jgi:hypothetical protein
MSLPLLQILSNSVVGFCLLFTDFQKAARKRVSFLLSFLLCRDRKEKSNQGVYDHKKKPTRFPGSADLIVF